MAEPHYRKAMRTLTLRINTGLDCWLAAEVKCLGRTKSEIVREALMQRRNAEKTTSLHDRMRTFCGIIKDGPRDLSTNTRKYLEGFGK